MKRERKASKTHTESVEAKKSTESQMGKLKIDDSEDMEVVQTPKAKNELGAELDLDRKPRSNLPILQIFHNALRVEKRHDMRGLSGFLYL